MLSSPTPILKPPLAEPDAGVVIATRHPAMRSALWAVIEATGGVAPIGATGDLRGTMTLLHFTQPEVVLADTAVLGPDLAGLATLRASAPDAAIIVIGTGDHPSYAAHARAAGAFDYVLLDDAAERMPAALDAATSALRR